MLIPRDQLRISLQVCKLWSMCFGPLVCWKENSYSWRFQHRISLKCFFILIVCKRTCVSWNQNSKENMNYVFWFQQKSLQPLWLYKSFPSPGKCDPNYSETRPQCWMFRTTNRLGSRNAVGDHPMAPLISQEGPHSLLLHIIQRLSVTENAQGFTLQL